MEDAMRQTFLALCLLALVFSSACTGNASGPNDPLSPTPNAPVPPSNAHSVNLPGNAGTFHFWLTINPAKESVLTVGQNLQLSIHCSGIAGYRYAIFHGFSNGPDTPPQPNEWISISGGGEGRTSRCGRDQNAISPVVTAQTPNLPYYRFRVWVRADEDSPLGGPGGVVFTTPPDAVFEEYIGWTVVK
jgi:hypothetical protein